MGASGRKDDTFKVGGDGRSVNYYRSSIRDRPKVRALHGRGAGLPGPLPDRAEKTTFSPMMPRRLSRRPSWIPLLPLLLLFVGCGAEDWTPGGEPWDPESPEARALLRAPEAGAPLDDELARAGEEWYGRRGCAACHTLGGGNVQGPDLLGVTVRREYDWFRGMVMNPDSMIRMDPDARALFQEFRVPMPNQGVSELQTRAMWEYLREVDR